MKPMQTPALSALTHGAVEFDNLLVQSKQFNCYSN